MNEEDEYYCEHCKKIWLESEVDYDETENEHLYPICEGYLNGI